MSLEALRQEIERQRLSSRAAAGLLKVSQSTFWRFLSGARAATEDSLAAAATFLREGGVGEPPALVAVGARPRQADYRLSLDAAQRERLARLAQDLGQEPAELLQDLAKVLLWPGPPSRVKSRWFRMTGQGWGRSRSPAG